MSQAGSAVTLPFVIQNGQTFIRDTFIQDATITMRKSPIISSRIISFLVSWLAGGKNGNAEFNNVTVRGTVYATPGNLPGK
jgi:hypothetical protein